jgi:ribosome recycling factor
MSDEIKRNFQDKSKKAISSFNESLRKLRTGRATAAMVESIVVDYYGTPTPLSQVASISVPEARLIVIQPWDKSMIKVIEKAIQKAELGFNPISDNVVIRVNIPPLTEETRLGIAKDAKNIAEQARVAVRNLRRDANDQAKKALKDNKLSEDQEKLLLDDIQKMTDSTINEVNGILAKKEKDILEI